MTFLTGKLWLLIYHITTTEWNIKTKLILYLQGYVQYHIDKQFLCLYDLKHSTVLFVLIQLAQSQIGNYKLRDTWNERALIWNHIVSHSATSIVFVQVTELQFPHLQEELIVFILLNSCTD